MDPPDDAGVWSDAAVAQARLTETAATRWPRAQYGVFAPGWASAPGAVQCNSGRVLYFAGLGCHELNGRLLSVEDYASLCPNPTVGIWTRCSEGELVADPFVRFTPDSWFGPSTNLPFLESPICDPLLMNPEAKHWGQIAEDTNSVSNVLDPAQLALHVSSWLALHQFGTPVYVGLSQAGDHLDLVYRRPWIMIDEERLLNGLDTSVHGEVFVGGLAIDDDEARDGCLE